MFSCDFVDRVSSKVAERVVWSTGFRAHEMKPAGIYIHIPFCRSRCSYCDFATGMYDSGLAERYVAGLLTEIKSFAEAESSETVDTIFFGGGTPSLLSPDRLT